MCVKKESYVAGSKIIGTTSGKKAVESGTHFRSVPWQYKYLFVDASEVDGHAELVVLHLGSSYALGLFHQRFVHLTKHTNRSVSNTKLVPIKSKSPQTPKK